MHLLVTVQMEQFQIGQGAISPFGFGYHMVNIPISFHSQKLITYGTLSFLLIPNHTCLGFSPKLHRRFKFGSFLKIFLPRQIIGITLGFDLHMPSDRNPGGII